MFFDELKRNAVLLALISATSLGLMGCSEQAAPPLKQEAGSIALPPVDKKVESKNYEGPLFPALKDGKYGYIDINGTFKIPPTFASAKRFSEGLAAVYVGGRSYIAGETSQYIDVEGGQWGYIDRSGEIKIAPQFGYANEFSEGLALVTTGNGWDGAAGYIDRGGLFKINPKFNAHFSSKFMNGIAAVRLAKIEEVKLDGGVFTNESGNKLSTVTTTHMLRESKRLHAGYWIDTSGAEINTQKALSILGVERFIFEKKNAINIHGTSYEVVQYGVKDGKGKVVVPAKFDRLDNFYTATSFSAPRKEEHVRACKASTWETIGDYAEPQTFKCGLIGVDGNYVAPPEFDDFFMLTKELAKFWIGCDSWRNCSNAKQGIYSIAQGKTIVNPRYEFIALAGDLIAVKADGKFGYIDINGKNVIEPKFSRGGIFADGLAQVDFPENYIDTTGKYVYKGTIGTLQPKAKESPEPASIGITPVNGAILKKSATGTAFIVSKSGQVITNHHVIDGCKEVRIEGRDGLVKVSTSDVVNDLALLQVPGTANATAAINSDPAKLRQGDDIVVYGFPLNSVLSSGGNLTPGVVSALTGLGNNTNQIQITAPIQPGSSGSPVLNKKGEVVGVVAMKLSDSKMAKATGQIGQNVNFAVSGQTLKSFLDTHKVDYSKSGFMNFDKSTADIADEAKKWTTVVECWK